MAGRDVVNANGWLYRGVCFKYHDTIAKIYDDHGQIAVASGDDMTPEDRDGLPADWVADLPPANLAGRIPYSHLEPVRGVVA